MKHLFLTPVDVWLFRDGRPFTASSDHRAESLFPPYPTTLQGAVRANQLALRNIPLWDYSQVQAAVGGSLGAPDARLNGLKLRGPYVAAAENGAVYRYYPLPADARVEKTPAGLYAEAAAAPRPAPPTVRFSSPRPPRAGSGDPLSPNGAELLPIGLGDALIPPAAGTSRIKDTAGLWLREDALDDYFGRKRVAVTESEFLFRRENRFGIGINGFTGVNRQGALYEVEFIRPLPGVGLLIEMDGYAGWPRTGTLQLGGEFRAAHYEQVDNVRPFPLRSGRLPRRFRVFLAAPAYFEAGWAPDDWGRFFGAEATLRAAAVPRYQSVGGFDLAAGQRAPNQKDLDAVTASLGPPSAHRPARRYVPAGSVYYFENTGADAPMPSALTEFGAEIGFGQFILFEEW